MRCSLLALAAVCCLGPLGQRCVAGVAAGSIDYRFLNEFAAVLVPDPSSPFNPGPDPIPLFFSYEGRMHLEWQDQAGDVVDLEYTRVEGAGALPTDPPTPYQILAGVELAPELGAFAGQLTNIVNAVGDDSQVASADYTAAGRYRQIFGGAGLYSVEPYSFDADVTQFPFPVGAELVNHGTENTSVYLQLGAAPDPATDLKVAETLPGGIVRVLAVVPEPSAVILLAIGCLSALSRRRSSSGRKIEVGKP
ncbi:MAG: PEP-CTERM sorting domain-containing protein, partial [Planctomycetales bacterium]|nr:PEP-CTERM sorting domain-containing protein [Planctomycetales bacterium]